MKTVTVWKRKLQIRLTSQITKKTIIYGQKDDEDFEIQVSGEKGLSSIKDKCTISIYNLTYVEMLELINFKYYDVEVWCGYETSGMYKLFKGGVTYITNKLIDKTTNEVSIFCASRLVAAYYQQRLNLTMNSGLNMYGAMNYLAKRCDIRTANISEQLKRIGFDENKVVSGNIANILDSIANSTNVNISSDASEESIVSIFDAKFSNANVILIKSSEIIIDSGYPKIDSNGLHFTMLPTRNLCPGNVIKIDNAIIDSSISSQSEITTNPAYYIDSAGKYVVYSIVYQLSNRSRNFEVHITAKSLTMFSSLTGGGTNAK